jgi:hypothetical protein
MTTILQSTSLAAIAALGLFAAGPARADHSDYERIDNLARRVQSESSQLYSELRHAGSSANLQQARTEVAEIYHLAGRIHDTAHFGGSRRQLDRDVHALERLVHHVQEHLSRHGHFRRHMDRIDSLTHQLEDRIHDLGERHGNGRSVHYGPGYGSSGINFGGRGFSIQIGR